MYMSMDDPGAREHGRVAAVLLAILLLIIVAVAAAGGAYYWQRHTINDLNRQISTLTTKISSLQKQQSVTTQQSSTPLSSSSSAASAYTSQKGVRVIVYTPVKDAKLTSPVGVVGKVPGSWSSEASFPIRINDSLGRVVAQGAGQLLGDWMTDQLVPFSAKLTYSSAAAGQGILVLQKDNPSGQVSNDDTVSVPIQL